MTVTNGNHAIEKLLDALFSTDDLTVVIRTHLHIQNRLDRFIMQQLPYDDEFPLSNSRLNWKDKVNLAVALGMLSRFRPALNKLNSIRNDFAHDPDTELREKRVGELFNCLAPEDRSRVTRVYERARENSKLTKDKDFEALPVREKFMILSVLLYTAVDAASEFREELWSMIQD